jgi:SNF family Na+-dependent transporter
VLVGIPLMWMEWAIGRYGGGYGHHFEPGNVREAMG